MSMNAVEILAGMYAGFKAGQIEKVIDCLRYDIEWHCQPGAPFGGVYHGKDGVREFFQKAAVMQYTVFEPHILLASADNSVATAFIKAVGTVTTTGKPIDQEFVHRWHFDSDGKATRIHEWVSDARAHAASFEA